MASVGEAEAAPLSAGPRSLFGPRGVCIGARNGPLWVADTGHHRLLGWARPAALAEEPADFVIGQADMYGDRRNRGGAPARNSLNMPSGLCRYGDGLALADAWNHRVLLWHHDPALQPHPDLVLGQRDFAAGEGNRGAAAPTADSLFWPSGVGVVGGRLLVADSGNRRLLVWDRFPEHNGQAADRVLGQPHMRTRDGRGPADATAMVYPHGVAGWRAGLAVADAGASRIMLWERFPDTDGAACDELLGQAGAAGGQPNRGHPRPAADTLAMPYALAFDGHCLIVADTANSRLLGWQDGVPETGAAAGWLHGQPDFERGGDNRWQGMAANSLCWPYGLDAHGGLLAIADTGNNRVQLWTLAHAC